MSSRLTTEVIPNERKGAHHKMATSNVEPGPAISIDELYCYGLLEGDVLRHGAVKLGAADWSYCDHRTGETRHANVVESFSICRSNAGRFVLGDKFLKSSIGLSVC